MHWHQKYCCTTRNPGENTESGACTQVLSFSKKKLLFQGNVRPVNDGRQGLNIIQNLLGSRHWTGDDIFLMFHAFQAGCSSTVRDPPPPPSAPVMLRRLYPASVWTVVNKPVNIIFAHKHSCFWLDKAVLHVAFLLNYELLFYWNCDLQVLVSYY